MKIQDIRDAKELKLKSINVKLHQDLKRFGKKQLGMLAQKHLTMPVQMMQI